MIKRDEIRDSTSCLNRSADDEPLFVLCARDQGFVTAVLAWINHSLQTGKNQATDPKILEAHAACEKAIEWRAINRPQG